MSQSFGMPFICQILGLCCGIDLKLSFLNRWPVGSPLITALEIIFKNKVIFLRKLSFRKKPFGLEH